MWFSSQSRPACPSAYPTQKLLATASPSSVICQSGCSPSVDTCGTGTYAVGLGGGGACNGATFSANAGQNCSTLGTVVSVIASTTIKVTAPAAPPACNAQPATPISAGGQSGEACSGAIAGSTCTFFGGGTGVCLPPGNDNGPGSCIMQAGAAACPSASPYSIAYLVGDSLNDTRVCSQATCAAPASCTGTIRMYDTDTCNAVYKLRQTFDGTCQTNANSAFTARAYTLDTPSGCSVQNKPVVTGGSAAFVNPQIVCCTGGN